MDNANLKDLVEIVDQFISKIDAMLPQTPAAVALEHSVAYRWRRPLYRGYLEPIDSLDEIRLDDLLCIDKQKQRVVQNTAQFVAGHPANNVLLTGSRGTGKSSLVKALLNEFKDDGLRVVEVEKHLLVDLPEIVAALKGWDGKYILYCDDLTFDANDQGYNALKVILDGSFTHAVDNVLVYATSNRRHLMPEFQKDNETSRGNGPEIHFHEAVDDKISLSERFGVWVTLHPFTQSQYLEIVFHCVQRLGVSVTDTGEFEAQALRWALARGSRSGRVAWQFARDWAGKQAMVGSSN